MKTQFMKKPTGSLMNMIGLDDSDYEDIHPFREVCRDVILIMWNISEGKYTTIDTVSNTA
ncbi:hypothetical protein KIN20_030635 [Parelaphostrongylus tenuis]|uniref:Uncharacterized protein n=1 Tax=Parelaphostrongylus tenuis TaxID=148309 RepID=A0AAD5R570_PARTN|nr:hypothetical protein KIN20_030635 [Parelaphostrongylus tenuis]